MNLCRYEDISYSLPALSTIGVGGGWGKWNINFLFEKKIPTGEWDFLHSLQYTGSYLEVFLWAEGSY